MKVWSLQRPWWIQWGCSQVVSQPHSHGRPERAFPWLLEPQTKQGAREPQGTTELAMEWTLSLLRGQLGWDFHQFPERVPGGVCLRDGRGQSKAGAQGHTWPAGCGLLDPSSRRPPLQAAVSGHLSLPIFETGSVKSPTLGTDRMNERTPLHPQRSDAPTTCGHHPPSPGPPWGPNQGCSGETVLSRAGPAKRSYLCTGVS